MHVNQSIDDIPQPPRLPVLGNLLQVNPNGITQSYIKLAREYGPVFRMALPGAGIGLVISGFSLVDELCDVRRFDKLVFPALLHLRPLGHDGLFSAHTSEPNWGKAHRILTPAFNPGAMRDNFEPMLEIVMQLLGKWEHEAGNTIDVCADMTRLTLDTIALCGFGYRIHSFEQDSVHPFVSAMTGALREALDRLRRLPIQTQLLFKRRRQFAKDIAFMNSTVDEVIEERQKAISRGETTAKMDLLSLMLSGADKVTGTTLSVENIRYQIITFLIAGHETTSGLLSFATYFLLENPEFMARAEAEADAVLNNRSGGIPTFEDLSQLNYVSAVLKEALRLWPTAPIWAVTPLQDTTIGQGRYPVKKGDNLMVLIPMLHRDKTVWGAEAEQFNPENFSAAVVKARPVNAYKPFGNGQRGCIGRHFAMQEAVLCLAMVLNRFKLSYAKPYRLKIKETLTVKPEGLEIRATPRRPASLQ